MKKILLVFAVFSLLLFCGCQEQARKTGGDTILSVDFAKGNQITYRMVSERQVELNLEGDPKAKGDSKTQKRTEKLEAVVTYNPVEVDLFGDTTLEAKINSLNVTRGAFTGKTSSSDAAESLAGETFRLKVAANGAVSDYSSLEKVVQQAGQKALSSKGSQGRIKDEEMIWDFIAMQHMLWSVPAAVPNPASGISVGDSWEGEQMVPLPMPIPVVKRGEFTVADISQGPEGVMATINADYDLSENNAKVLKPFPDPYEGNFRLKGMFGFLRGYKFKSLQGQGVTVYDVSKGRLVSDSQNYKMDVTAQFLMPLGDSVPVLKFDQKIDITLVNK